MPDPLVSVVVPVRDGERYLRAAVDSVLEQSFRDFELVIVDDGSTDSTPAILEGYAQTDDRVRVLRQEPRGQVSALNAGCAAARGQYIARMDADDVCFRTRLERQVDFLRAHPKVDLLGAGCVLIDAAGAPLLEELYPPGDREIKEELCKRNCIAHSTVIVRTAAFQAIGAYRPVFPLAADYDLFLRLADRSTLANLQELLIYRRVHSDKVTLLGLRDQCTLVLAAKASAERRREGQADPLTGLDRLTPEVLSVLAVEPEAVDEYTLAASLSWGQLLLAAGQKEAAVDLFQQALTLAWSSPRPRPARAVAHAAAAKAFLRHGAPLRGAGHAVRSVAADPARAARRLRRRPL